MTANADYGTRAKRCRSCGEICQRSGRMRYHGRGLCSRCYYRADGDGTLNDYPTDAQRAMTSGFDCECPAPIPQPIPLFQAVQCARCGKRLLLPNDGSPA